MVAGAKAAILWLQGNKQEEKLHNPIQQAAAAERLKVVHLNGDSL